MERAAGSTEPLIHNNIAVFHPSKGGSHLSQSQDPKSQICKNYFLFDTLDVLQKTPICLDLTPISQINKCMAVFCFYLLLWPC